MVDDHTQRPYRSSDSIARAPAKPADAPRGGGSGSDPLAELARLIGQTDPFSEYGRAQPAPAAPDARAAASQPAPAQSYFAAPQPALPPEPDPANFNPPNFARQPFGGAPLAAGSDLYQVENNEHAYPPAAQDGGYEDDGYRRDTPHPATGHDDYYEDVAPSGRRMSVMVIAGIFALAVIGTAGAFGYRALFGSSGSSAPPPVIKADTAPSKIVPASTRDPQSNKLITDRVNERAPSEKLVSREEQPIDIKDKGMFPPLQDQSGAAVMAQGSGVVSPDAKKVRTIAIRPDQAVVADATPASVPQPASGPPPRVVNITPRQATPAAPPTQQQTPPPRVVASAPPAAADPEPELTPPKRQTATRVPPAVAQHQAAAPAANAPLSLSPDAAPARPAPRAAAATVRTAAVSSTPAAAGAGSYAVQISSQRSEAEAQAAFRGLQGKYPGQLGNRQPLIHRVDLGEKGVYYRAMVGPFATGSEASQLCSSLKAAGGSCLVQKN